ncbi:MAG: ABC transporter permease [Spirochaetota bacterium]
MSFWAFFQKNADEVLLRTVEHLQITVVSVSLAVLIGVPLGLLLVHFRRAAPPVQYILGIMQTIPSLALLGFLIPIAGIGFKPSVIALVIYSLLVIVQNTIIGIKQIDPSIIESAAGVGMNKWQILFKVQIPLALPVIVTGIRIATVTCVGIATLVAAIGAGALGTFIFRGINILDSNLILTGAIPSALLAVLLDTLLIFCGKLLDPN